MRILATLLLLSGCYKTTQVFTPQPDSLEADVTALELGISAANQIAGCKLIALDFNAVPNLTFSTNPTCYARLAADDAEGETRLSTLDAPRICVRSFATYPQATQWDGILAAADSGNTTGHITSNAAAAVVLLHEIGHAEGVLPHSKTLGDIMYADGALSRVGLYNDESLRRYVAELKAEGAKCLE